MKMEVDELRLTLMIERTHEPCVPTLAEKEGRLEAGLGGAALNVGG